MNGRNLIFLDVDGVLNNDSTKQRTPGGFIGIDPKNLKNLWKIICETGAYIVLSSSWRTCWDKAGDPDEDGKYLINELSKSGIEIFAFTPKCSSRYRRGLEIFTFLEDCPCDGFVILDDEEFEFGECGLNNHFVNTNYFCGLTSEDAEEAIRIINGENEENNVHYAHSYSNRGHRGRKL